MPISWDAWVKTACPCPALTATGQVTLAIDAYEVDSATATIVWGSGGKTLTCTLGLSRDMPGNPVYLSRGFDWAGPGTIGWFYSDSIAATSSELLSFDFAFTPTYVAERWGTEPEAGHTYFQHPRECHAQDGLCVDEFTTLPMTVAGYSHTIPAGDVAASLGTGNPFLMVGATASLYVDEVFDNLVFCGVSVPCDGISSTDAIGAGDGVTIPATKTWTGTIWEWYEPGYADLPVLLKWMTEYIGARLVDGIECEKTGAPAYILEENARAMAFPVVWKFTSAPGTWASPAPAYDAFHADPTVHMAIQAVSVQAGGSHEDEADADTFIPVLAWPKNATSRLAVAPGPVYPNRFNALTIAVPQGVELELKNAGDRCSPWVLDAGAGITIDNGAGYTQFTVAGAGGSVKRTLVVRQGARIAASGTPWIPYRQFVPDADEDIACLCPEGSHLGIYGYFDWAAAGDRTFTFKVKHKPRSCSDNHAVVDATRLAAWVYTEGVEDTLTFSVTVLAANKGVAMWHLVDVDFGIGESATPDIFLASEYLFTGLIDGDDVRFTSMYMWPQADMDFTSGHFQASVPFSTAVYDHFGVACLIGGHQTWHLTEDNLDQVGGQQGIAHVDYRLSGAADVSVTRFLHNAGDFMRSLDDLIAAQGSWSAAVHADVDAALGLTTTKLTDDHAFFLRQVAATGPDGGGNILLQASVKVATLKLAACIPYSIEFEGRVRGVFHGLGYTAGRVERATAGLNIETVLCSGGIPGPTIVDVALTDAWGHYCTAGLYEELSYHVREATGCYSTRNVEKRWTEVLIYTAAKWCPANWCEPWGRWFQAFVRNGRVYFHQRANPESAWAADVQVTTATGWSDPSIVALPTGMLVIAAHNVAGALSRIHTSADDGDTWLEGADMALAKTGISERQGILYAVGVDGANAKYCYSEDCGASWSALVTIGVSDDEQPGIAVLDTLQMAATVTASGVMVNYASRDYGAHWSVV